MNPRLRMQVYRTTHTLHWISAAVCFFVLLLFTVTGITLNHATAISATPKVTTHEASVPESLRASLAPMDTPTVTPDLGAWLRSEFGVPPSAASAEWSDEELYVSAPGPGRDAWVSIDRQTFVARSEITDRGWIAYLNDLHKGRNTGTLWTLFIDLVAAACLFFTLTGLVLLQIQARQRTSTWPLVTGGAVLAIALMIFAIH